MQLPNEAVKRGLGGMSIATVFSQLITSPRSSNSSFSLVSASETTLQPAASVAREAYRVKSSANDGSEALSFFAILPTSVKGKVGQMCPEVAGLHKVSLQSCTQNLPSQSSIALGRLNGVYSLKWRLTDRYLMWGTLAYPRPGHGDQCKSSEFLSAGTAHRRFPALLSVPPPLLSREIMMSRRHLTFYHLDYLYETWHTCS